MNTPAAQNSLAPAASIQPKEVGAPESVKPLQDQALGEAAPAPPPPEAAPLPSAQPDTEKVGLSARLLTAGFGLAEKLTSTRGRRAALVGAVAAGATVVLGARYGIHLGGTRHLQETAQTVPFSGSGGHEPASYAVRHTVAGVSPDNLGLQLDDIKRGEGLHHYLERAGITSPQERAQIISSKDGLIKTFIQEGDVVMHGDGPWLSHKGALHEGSKQAIQTFHKQWLADQSAYVGVEGTAPAPEVPADQPLAPPEHQPEATPTETTPKTDSSASQPEQPTSHKKEKHNEEPSPALVWGLGAAVVAGWASAAAINRHSRAWITRQTQKAWQVAHKLGRNSKRIPAPVYQTLRTIQAKAARVEPGDADYWLSSMRPGLPAEMLPNTPDLRHYRPPVEPAEPLEGVVVTLDELLDAGDQSK